MLDYRKVYKSVMLIYIMGKQIFFEDEKHLAESIVDYYRFWTREEGNEKSLRKLNKTEILDFVKIVLEPEMLK